MDHITRQINSDAKDAPVICNVMLGGIMLNLIPFKEKLEALKGDEYGFEGKLNLILWLGERVHLLISEIEHLRAQQGIQSDTKKRAA